MAEAEREEIMSSIDIVCQYCIFNDYPIFRRNMAKYRDKFNKIILYPSRHHGHIDLEEFAKRVFPETWVEPVAIDYGVQDWRQAETEPCLKHIEAEWVWFTEQDFFVRDWDWFYKAIEEEMKLADMIGWMNLTHYHYIHPCCLFIKKEVLDKTQKDFRAHPEIDGCDHFAMLTRDVEKMGKKITPIQGLTLDNGQHPKEWEDFFHLGGLTYPYQNWGFEKHFGVGNKEAFYSYNYWSRKAEVEQSPEYLKLSEEVEEELNNRFRMKMRTDPENNKWKEFFK